jgi:hypothetical protein
VAEVDRQLFHGHPEVVDADLADYFRSTHATEPATRPAMAPLMHPLAWAAEENASPRTAAQMKSLLTNEFGGIVSEGKLRHEPVAIRKTHHGGCRSGADSRCYQ